MKKKQAAFGEPVLPSGLRPYLLVTAACTGAAVMIVEILGAKMLSPYLGTSHFVWTAQIAITLVALAFGYYAGGWLVDRNTRVSRLYAAILGAGVYLACTVALTQWVVYGCLRFNHLAIASLLASTFLFFVPLFLLAMVCPFLVRILTVSVSGVGGNVGRLTALSTFGSFVGTVLIGYVLIPFLPNSVTMYLTAALLMALGAGYFLGWRKKGDERMSALLPMLVALGVGYGGVRAGGGARSGVVELYRGNSNFGMLQVWQSESGPVRYYLNDYLVQNTYDTNRHQSTSMFTYMLHGLAKAYSPQTRDVLCIGLGVGIVPMEFAREGARVDAVEINPAVVQIGRSYFELQPEKLNIVLGDGRYWLNRTTNRYDAVILDAFLGDSCPSHLMTQEAFSAIRKVLRPEGTLVINTFADFEPGRDFFAGSLYQTLGSVFPSVRIHSEGSGNTLFVASSRSDARILHPPDLDGVHPSCAGRVRASFATLREPGAVGGRVLTDDFNPVEFHDAANRERLRRDLALSVRPDP